MSFILSCEFVSIQGICCVAEEKVLNLRKLR